MEKEIKKHKFAIFLDIDGVLNNKEFYRDNPQPRWEKSTSVEDLIKHFDKSNVEHFKYLIHILYVMFNAKIDLLISSSWRKNFSQDLISDVLKHFDIEILNIKTEHRSLSKSKFVKKSLFDYGLYHAAIILDDKLNLYKDVGDEIDLHNCKHILKYQVNENFGLRKSNCNKIYEELKTVLC